MQYFVVLPDGQKFGPADLAMLNQWASEGRLTAQSQLEDASTGQRIFAVELAGLNVPGAPGVPGFDSPQPQPQPQPQSWNNPPQSASPYPRTPYVPADNGQKELTMAWVFGSIGLLCCPIIFSTMGIVYAVQAKNKGHAGGTAAMIFSICTLVVGIGLGIVLNLSRFARF